MVYEGSCRLPRHIELAWSVDLLATSLMLTLYLQDLPSSRRPSAHPRADPGRSSRETSLGLCLARNAKALSHRWTIYQRDVLEEAGLHSRSWIPYYLPDGNLVSLLVLGLGFGKVLHKPLKPGIIEKVKKALGREDEPQWYLFDAKSRF